MRNPFKFLLSKKKPSYLPKLHRSVATGEGNFQIPPGEAKFNWTPMVKQDDIKNREMNNALGRKTLQQIEEEQIQKETNSQCVLFSDCDAGGGFSPHEKIIIRGIVREMIRYSTLTVITCRLLLSSYADIPKQLQEKTNLQPVNKQAIADVNKLHDILMDPFSILRIFKYKAGHICQESADVWQGALNYESLANKTAILGDPIPPSAAVTAKKWLAAPPFVDLNHGNECRYKNIQPFSSPYQGIYVESQLFHYSKSMQQRVYLLYQYFAYSQIGITNAPLILKDILDEYG